MIRRPTPPGTLQVFVARQPIYTAKLDLYAYELLFRSDASNVAGITDGDLATSQLVLNALLEIGLDNLIWDKVAFVNMTRDFLLEDYSLVFPPGRIVMEVLEDITVDAELIAAVRAQSARGYTIALDDFVYRESLQPLVDIADIIKVDVLVLERDALREHVRLLSNPDVKLLAEKVETQAMFRDCRDLGFDLFQGYFFCRPEIVQGRRTPASRLHTLQLLARLQDPDAEFGDLEALLSRDVTLSYKLLRVINSAFYSLPVKLKSLRQALLMLGTRFITNWVSLIVLARIDDKPHELMVVAMVRAKMCELLAQARGSTEADSFFTVGLFSTLDALLDTPMPGILSSVSLADEIAAALLHHAGPMGETLRCVLAFERGDWKDVRHTQLEDEDIQRAYLQAIAWARVFTDMIA